MANQVQWTGQANVKRAMDQYGRDVRSASKALANRWAVDIENYAKDNAPWDDQSSNARQSLRAWADDRNNRLIIYLSHGVEYGVWLELKYQGKYAIIERTLDRYRTPVMDSFRGLLR